MATEILAILQSTGEVRTHYIDFTNDLATGVVVSSATATHTPPSGTAITPTIGVIASNIVPVVVPALAVAGRHIITVSATLSTNDISVARLIIPVQWDSSRTTMAELIAELRAMTNAGSNDYTVGGIPFWTDKQMQTALDRYRREVVEEQLVYLDENNGGTINITRYYSRHGNYEQTSGGTAIFVVRDSGYNVVGSASYTPDYLRGEVIFTTNTSGSAYYLTGRSYDLNAAAADVWDKKASQAMAASYSWSTDNMRVDKTGMRKEAAEMARYYRSLAGPISIDMERGDT